MAASKIAELPVLPFPPAGVLEEISDEELRPCFDAWSAISQKLLSLPPELFRAALSSSNSQSMTTFLASYIDENANQQQRAPWKQWPQAQVLDRQIYLLVHRTLKEEDRPPDVLLDWRFLAGFCKLHAHAKATPDLLQIVWNRHESSLSIALQKHKITLTKGLDDGSLLSTESDAGLQRLLALMHACPQAGASFASGSDLLDSINNAYPHAPKEVQSHLLMLAYLILLAPLQVQKPNRSLIYDHLYSLRASAEKEKVPLESNKSLLIDLVSQTPYLARLRKLVAGSSDEGRGFKLAGSLENYRSTQPSRPRKPRRAKVHTPGSTHANSFGHGETINGEHVHRISMISQVQELFPDLGDGFIVKLLDFYNDSVEEVTAALLEDNLPHHLATKDRSERLQANRSAHEIDHAPDLAPHSTPPQSPLPSAERRNVHDNDEFDRLAVRASQVHFGRKDTDRDTFKQDPSSRTHAKAAIMAALAAFDADDDERDDTYDIADVGGTVDTAAGPASDRDANIDDMRQPNEEALYAAWKMDQTTFARDAATRRGKARQALKSETGLTDEALEGWAVMLQRDPARLRKMQAKYEMSSGRQNLEVNQNHRGLLSEGEDTDGASSGPESSLRGRGGGPFRGRGRGGRGRGGNVAGPSNEKGTQVSRERKEASKGSRANHNRRDQRARKMGRGGLPG